MLIDLKDIYGSIIRGCDRLDYAAKDGACPINWRSTLNLDDVRFGDVEKSIPAIVFGSLDKARQHKSFRFAGSMHEGGFKSTIYVGATELKNRWKNHLQTEPAWFYIRDTNSYLRTIKGVRFEIKQNDENIISLYLTRSGSPVNVGEYKNVESAKRAVRKLVQRGEL